MKPIKITDNIYWVGAIDWDLRNFHGYLTPHGSTYNSYLIIDEKITLIDTVKAAFSDEMLERIRQIIDPSKIDLIVSNHVEMDHSGALPQLMKLCPSAELYCSPQGEKGLFMHFQQPWAFNPVKTGDTIDLGRHQLNVINTPLVHWPDNMILHCPQAEILFSNDSFGQHLASNERFDDEYNEGVLEEELKKYYANIVMPYGNQVQKELAEVAGLNIKTIAPSHGLVWRSSVAKAVSLYQQWSLNKTEEKAVIVYDTMWGSTEKMAHAIEQYFIDKNIKVHLYNLQTNHISDIMTDILEAKYICVGSATLNSNMLPTVAAFLTYLKGLSPKGRDGLAFGSYGWGGQSIIHIAKDLEACGFKLLDPIKMQFVPNTESLKRIAETLNQ